MAGHETHSAWTEYAALPGRLRIGATPFVHPLMVLGFDGYVEPVGRAWLAARVVLLLGGRPVWREQYVDVRTGTRFDASLFDPRRFAEARPRH